MRKKVLLLFNAVFFIITGYSQGCFEAFDLLFVDENKSLTHDEFRVLENNFLENLIGCNAIDFNVKTLDGEDLIFESLKGKVVVLNFWFTTCLPCLKEIPELNKVEALYDSDEVVFIGFARDTPNELNSFFKRFGLFNYKIVPESYAVADAYKVLAWPQSMVIDKQGKVYKSWIGLHGGADKLAAELKVIIDNCLAN